MKLFFSVLLVLLLVACGNHKKLNVYSGYVEVISNSDSTINELSAISDSVELNGMLNARFRSISENRDLYSTRIPAERIVKKSMLFEACKALPDSCNYVPEGYTFSVNRNFLNVKYQYNAFRSYDLFYKHVVLDLATSKRLVYFNMFADPNQALDLVNARYIKEKEDYLAGLTGDDLNEQDQEEFDVIRNHLDSGEPFTFDDLNNFELIFDAKKRRFTEIRFHYNGLSGVYRNILTEGYISFTLKELDEFLLKEFKVQMGK